MATNSVVSKKKASAYKEEEDEEEEVEEGGKVMISNQIRLKPGRPSDKMDKDVVLRRIRHRIRVNKFKNAVHSLFGFPFSSSAAGNDDAKKNSVHQRQRRWVDDPFASL